MRAEFQAKLLQYVIRKNAGFTLIELLVVIVVVGILAAIAYPSFVNQAVKARQAEARTYIGSINRAQQSYYMENGSVFANQESFERLGIGIRTQTNNYRYAIEGGGVGEAGAIHRGEIRYANPDQSPMRSYVGAVRVVTLGNEASTVTVLCEGKSSPSQGGKVGTAADAAAAIITVDTTTGMIGCNGTDYVPADR